MTTMWWGKTMTRFGRAIQVAAILAVGWRLGQTVDWWAQLPDAGGMDWFMKNLIASTTLIVAVGAVIVFWIAQASTKQR